MHCWRRAWLNTCGNHNGCIRQKSERTPLRRRPYVIQPKIMLTTCHDYHVVKELLTNQLEWVHLYWFYWFAVWNFFRIWQFYVPKGRYKYFAMISMWWGLVILYSRYHIILLPQCWWRLVILLSCYRIILPSLTTLSYRLRTGCHCSILPSLACEHSTREYVSKKRLWTVAPCFCRLSLLSCPFLLHHTRKSIKIKMHWWPHRIS